MAKRYSDTQRSTKRHSAAKSINNNETEWGPTIIRPPQIYPSLPMVALAWAALGAGACPYIKQGSLVRFKLTAKIFLRLRKH